jgi:hypothetical protein
MPPGFALLTRWKMTISGSTPCQGIRDELGIRPPRLGHVRRVKDTRRRHRDGDVGRSGRTGSQARAGGGLHAVTGTRSIPAYASTMITHDLHQ